MLFKDMNSIYLKVVLLLSIPAMGVAFYWGFVYGKSVGNRECLIGMSNACKYLNVAAATPSPVLDRPSVRALEAASYIYVNSSSSDQKKLRDDWGYGRDEPYFATTNLAAHFDQNPDTLTLAEAWVEKNKADRTRPVFTYEPPAVIQQPAPVVQQQTYPKHCTSNTVGGYTYTNCY